MPASFLLLCFTYLHKLTEKITHFILAKRKDSIPDYTNYKILSYYFEKKYYLRLALGSSEQINNFLVFSLPDGLVDNCIFLWLFFCVTKFTQNF